MARNRPPPKIQELLFMGYYHSPRGMQKTMICQAVTCFIMFIFYIHWNGGIVPWFLLDSTASPVNLISAAKLVEHFPITNGDGSIVKWGHATNDRSTLVAAIEDPGVMMLEGDIQLKGQGSTLQQLLPVMVHHFNTENNKDEFIFEDWLKVALESEKGIKLDFKTIEPVEIALQHLASKKLQIKRAVHISADILEGPNGGNSNFKPVDPARFLRLVSSRFPDSTIVAGWTASSEDGLTTARYNWDMVKEMYDTLASREIKQPLSISVRAIFVKQSLPQLKWLFDMMNLQMTVYSLETEKINTNDLLFVRHKFPIDSVYYDLHNTLSASFDKDKDNTANIAKEMMNSNLVFQSEEWKVEKNDESVVYMGTESLVMQTGFVAFKNDPYVFTNEPLKIKGRLEFFYIPDDTESHVNIGLEIFLHVSNNVKADHVSGIRLYIGLDGSVTLGPYGVKDPESSKSQSISMEGDASCFSFEMTEIVGSSVNVEIWRPLNCDEMTKLNHESAFLGKLTLSLVGINLSHKHIAIRSGKTSSFVAIDNFVISSS